MINKKLADILKSHWIKNVCLQLVITKNRAEKVVFTAEIGKRGARPSRQPQR
jgi:hypothetical protein